MDYFDKSSGSFIESLADRLGMSLRGKLIAVFLVSKIIPLIVLTAIAWYQINILGETLRRQAIDDATVALNRRVIENIETTIANLGAPGSGSGSGSSSSGGGGGSSSSSSSEGHKQLIAALTTLKDDWIVALRVESAGTDAAALCAQTNAAIVAELDALKAQFPSASRKAAIEELQGRVAAITFDPEGEAYAGLENPNGAQFEGIICWIEPVYGSTDSTNNPGSSNGTLLERSGSADLAGLKAAWPSLVYDPELHDREDREALNLIQGIPVFDDQSYSKQLAPALEQAGYLGLDGRYLNNAPQCAGWMDLMRDGGSGSFNLRWSDITKLTTAAAIRYYTGQYEPSALNGFSQRGFGMVTIGKPFDMATLVGKLARYLNRNDGGIAF